MIQTKDQMIYRVFCLGCLDQNPQLGNNSINFNVRTAKFPVEVSCREGITELNKPLKPD